MKYKIGDKVKVREDIEAWDKYYGCEHATPPMVKFAGKLVTISERYDIFKVYNIDDDGGVWAWTDEMFEEVPKGDTVVEVSNEVHTPDKLVITTKGKRVTAKLYCNERVISRKEASCHPDDEFDFRQGVKLVIDRLGLSVGSNGKPKDFLENGLFAYDSKKGWAIVFNNNLVYANGNFAAIYRFDNDLVDIVDKERRIERIVRAKSFSLAENEKDAIWERKR